MIKDIIIHVGAKPKASFRPYQPLEPQPRGAVTRRAVAQRRSRAGGLTRLSAEAIRGLGWVLVVGSLVSSAAGMVLEAVATGSPYQEEHGLFE